MIPPFDENGNLPEGIWPATIDEVEERFGANPFRRREHFKGLLKAIEILKAAGCRTLFLDGSFVTAELLPKDYDALVLECEVGEKVNEILYKHPNVQKKEYKGEFYFAENLAYDKYLKKRVMFLELFQTSPISEDVCIKKGIISIQLV